MVKGLQGGGGGRHGHGSGGMLRGSGGGNMLAAPTFSDGGGGGHQGHPQMVTTHVRQTHAVIDFMQGSPRGELPMGGERFESAACCCLRAERASSTKCMLCHPQLFAFA